MEEDFKFLLKKGYWLTVLPPVTKDEEWICSISKLNKRKKELKVIKLSTFTSPIEAWEYGVHFIAKKLKLW